MFSKDSSTVMKNTNSKEIKCVKPNSLVIEIPFKITNLPIFIILIINISMMISPWWLQLITVWSHICFLLPVPHLPSLLGTKCGCLVVADEDNSTLNPPQPQQAKQVTVHFQGMITPRPKVCRSQEALSYPDISGVLEFTCLWQRESMSSTGPCAGHRHTVNPCTKPLLTCSSFPILIT